MIDLLIIIVQFAKLYLITAPFILITCWLVSKSPKAQHFFDMDYEFKEDKHDGTLL